MNQRDNMAEAMLEDSYRSSHEDLQEWAAAGNGDESAPQQLDEQEEPIRNDNDDDISCCLETDQEQLCRDSGATSKFGTTSENSSAKRSSERTVVIQVPPKRTKFSAATCNPKELVQALGNCISQKERYDAIQTALASLDHHVQSLHDTEIEEGVDVALLKYIVFCEFKTGFRRKPFREDLDAITREMNFACEALEFLYRASSESVAKSFRRIGTDLLQLIVTWIDEEVKMRCQAFSPDCSPEGLPQKQSMDAASIGSKSLAEGRTDGDTSNHENDDSTKKLAREQDADSRSVTPPLCHDSFGTMKQQIGSDDRDLLLRRAAKLLGHFAGIGEATKAVAHYPGLLGSVLNLINLRPFYAIPWEARLSCLWSIANLACNTENMQMMMCTPGLVNSLVNVGCRPFSHPPSNCTNEQQQQHQREQLETTMDVLRSRSIASRALLNLSWPPENKIPMAENMALVQVLCQLALLRDFPLTRKSRTVDDIALQTRRHAVGAIRNLAAAPRRSKICLCDFSNGRLLDVLTDAALNDPDQRVKDLSFAAIHNLANHDTAQMMVVRPALVMALKNVLLATEEEEDARMLEAQTSRHNDASSFIYHNSSNQKDPLHQKQQKQPDSPRTHASSTLLVLERSITPDMNSYENLRDLLEAVNQTPSSEPEEFDEELEVINATAV